MKKKKITQIVVPILILAIIGGMYLLKNPVLSATTNSAETDTVFALNVTEAIDFEALAEYGLPTIIDYGADSCIPCKQMAPVLVALNKEMKGKALIKFADVWQYPEAASNVPIQVIPTQVLINADGTPFIPSEELAAQVEFLMYRHKDTGEHIFTVHQGGLTEEHMRSILKEMGVE